MAGGGGGGGGGGGPVIVNVAFIDFVVSVSEVALMVTVPPVGTVAGAVYVVGTSPLASVVVELNDPHSGDPQLAVQISPVPRGSFVAIAARSAVVLTASEVGGNLLKNESVIGVGRIVKVTLLACDGLLVIVAVIVTVVPIGVTDGAVKTATPPSVVCAGVSVPHAPLVKIPVVGLPRQVTVQSTPALMTSFDGIMLRFNLEPIERATAGLVRPFAFAIVIGFAVTPDVELFPQPAITTPIKLKFKHHRYRFMS